MSNLEKKESYATDRSAERYADKNYKAFNYKIVGEKIKVLITLAVCSSIY